ncbi:hypothetical protein E2C01_057518 [Portunus trituberculatus]|uniref:Uncharacterized protein n=1 Tax=Portunus trituberculatus TaxID=210409 RepID=A0A5B7GTQ7_PORTR|nr:hypothetical protein [Portunus trituberculatus]
MVEKEMAGGGQVTHTRINTGQRTARGERMESIGRKQDEHRWLRRARAVRRGRSSGVTDYLRFGRQSGEGGRREIIHPTALSAQPLPSPHSLPPMRYAGKEGGKGKEVHRMLSHFLRFE